MTERHSLVPPLVRSPAESPARRRLAILGSTGSIGRSALDVVRAHRERFEVTALCAGRNAALLAEQVREFSPHAAVLADEWPGELAAGFTRTECLAGAAAACAAARRSDVDVVLAGTVGMAGLGPVFAAVEAGKTVALANKESLVMAGELLAERQRAQGGALIPVDSEHSAIFQALQGARMGEVRSLILTASGGPFLHTPLSEWAGITPAQALKHPKWSMGAKISIDSATMVNKALELIEAYWLFGVRAEQIQVVVHPQSIVHSLVEFVDGSLTAQLSHPDMKGPIAYALGYPGDRLPKVVAPLSLAEIGRLEFLPLDESKFRAVPLAQAALKAGGAMPAVFTVSNEFAVGAFLDGRLPFSAIVPTIEGALERFAGAAYRRIEDLAHLSGEVSRWVEEQV